MESSYELDTIEGYDVQLFQRIHVYRGVVVDFCIKLEVRPDGLLLTDDDMSVHPWSEIQRTDCCHSTVHRHHFDRNHNETSKHDLVVLGPFDGPVVNSEHGVAYDYVLDNYESLVRQWGA
ncbi:hypothetical protein RhoFasGS6_02094 [Rhodococcus fascians]|nr:hypothetical protein [Rhodococcus fascians]